MVGDYQKAGPSSARATPMRRKRFAAAPGGGAASGSSGTRGRLGPGADAAAPCRSRGGRACSGATRSAGIRPPRRCSTSTPAFAILMFGKMRAGRNAGSGPQRVTHLAGRGPCPGFCDFSAAAPSRSGTARNENGPARVTAGAEENFAGWDMPQVPDGCKPLPLPRTTVAYHTTLNSNENHDRSLDRSLKSCSLCLRRERSAPQGARHGTGFHHIERWSIHAAR